MDSAHKAAARNDVEALAAMLDAQPGLVHAWHDDEDWEAETAQPLHCACSAGSVETAALLLDRGADISANRDGYSYCRSPLSLACGSGRPALVSLLLARGADPTAEEASEAFSECWWNTPLLVACCSARGARFDRLGVIRLLLEDGRVPVDARDGWGCTALLHACSRGDMDMVRLLVWEGHADHTIADDEGKRPVDVAKDPALIALLKWLEGERIKPLLLSKARAVVGATESISKAPEKMGAKTEAEVRKARIDAAPNYLKARVNTKKALPGVEVIRQARFWDDEEEEEWAVLSYVVWLMGEDLYIELMEGLRNKRRFANEVREEGGEEGKAVMREEDDDSEDDADYDDEWREEGEQHDGEEEGELTDYGDEGVEESDDEWVEEEEAGEERDEDGGSRSDAVMRCIHESWGRQSWRHRDCHRS